MALKFQSEVTQANFPSGDILIVSSLTVIYVPVLLASSEKAERQLGWSRRFPDLDTILATAWAWHKKH
jgi:hypothetical protein